MHGKHALQDNTIMLGAALIRLGSACHPVTLWQSRLQHSKYQQHLTVVSHKLFSRPNTQGRPENLGNP